MTPGAKRESKGGAAMVAEKRRFLEILRKTSFQAREEATFRLASGKFSRYYIDCKQALSYPKARDLIAHLIYDRIRGEVFDDVGGLEIGAYPIATSVSTSCFAKLARRSVHLLSEKSQKRTASVTCLRVMLRAATER
jgi:orotate phosphoribosyltransferase